MRVPGGVKFVGEMLGIVDGPSALAAGLTVVCFLGMKGGMKIMNDRTFIMQQKDLSSFIRNEVQREVYNQTRRHF